MNVKEYTLATKEVLWDKKSETGEISMWKFLKSFGKNAKIFVGDCFCSHLLTCFPSKRCRIWKISQKPTKTTYKRRLHPTNMQGMRNRDAFMTYYYSKVQLVYLVFKGFLGLCAKVRFKEKV